MPRILLDNRNEGLWRKHDVIYFILFYLNIFIAEHKKLAYAQNTIQKIYYRWLKDGI